MHDWRKEFKNSRPTRWLKSSSALLELLLLFTSVLPAGAAGDDQKSQAEVMTDEQIRGILRTYIERDHWGVGIVVGIIDEKGSRVISYGKIDHGETPDVDGDTLFEIGSITKTFTTLLLADMIDRGEMRMDDPVENYLPRKSTFSDPAPGIRKRLIVRFRLHGWTTQLEANEGEQMEIPPGSEILKGTYGDVPAKDRVVDVTQKIAALVEGSRGAAVKIRAENTLAVRDVPLKVPEWKGRKITLHDLATHTAGLPRESQGEVYEFLSKCRLPRAPGRQAEYSNFGVALLARAIELKAGTNYEALLQQRICRPLKMESTCIIPTPALKARLSKSHNKENETVGDLADELGSFPGAGAIRSSANDMLRYLEAQLGLKRTPLTSLMEVTHVRQISRAFGEVDLALPWWIFRRNGAEFITHGGTTWGHQAFIGFDKKARRGVVILANREDTLEQAIRPLGLYLLSPAVEEPIAAPVALGVLESYAGLYEFRNLPQAVLTIRAMDGHLRTQFLNSAAGDWLPVSTTEFVDRWRDGATLRFTRNLFGRRFAVFKTAEKTFRAPRIHAEVPEDLLKPARAPVSKEKTRQGTASELQGTWEAVARPWYWPFISMRGILRVSDLGPGDYRGEFDFPKMGVSGMPVLVHYHPAKQEVEIFAKSGDGMFKGTLNADRTSMRGYYIVGGRWIGTLIRRVPNR
jgi:CubicO group peptidase (beta-lactamase class C family)